MGGEASCCFVINVLVGGVVALRATMEQVFILTEL
jgi:hypothetical protein